MKLTGPTSRPNNRKATSPKEKATLATGLKESLQIACEPFQLISPPESTATTSYSPNIKPRMKLPLDLRRVTRSINESVVLINS